MAPDNDVFSFIKDWLWAPALGLIAWAWTRNEKEHDRMRDNQESLRNHTSSGYSVLNDRMMEHIDTTVAGLRDEQRRRSDKMADHIEKLFENAEHDRAAFRDALTVHSQQSTERHIELMTAIHTGLARKADK